MPSLRQLASSPSAKSMAASSCVKYGDDDGEVFVGPEVDAIGKGAHDGLSEAIELDELLGALSDAGHGRVDGLEKPESESWVSAFVPDMRVSNLERRLRPNQNSKGQ